MKHWQKHLIDCGIGSAISFFTAITVMDAFTTKAILTAIAAAIVVGLIKARESIVTHNKKGSGFIFI